MNRRLGIRWGAFIGFGVGVFILAKLPEVQSYGLIHYMSKVENVLQGSTLIGLCLIFGIVFGALFDKAPAAPSKDDSQKCE